MSVMQIRVLDQWRELVLFPDIKFAYHTPQRWAKSCYRAEILFKN